MKFKKMVRSIYKLGTWKLLLQIFFFVSLFYSVYAKDCLKNDKCSCTFDDGSGTMDLSNLGQQTGDPLIKDVAGDDGFQYSFNPCYPFTEKKCRNVAACQIDVEDQIYYPIGDPEEVQFSFNGKDVVANYTATDGTSVVTFICDQSSDTPKFVVKGAQPAYSMTYIFRITCKEVCPQDGPPGSTSIPSPTDVPAGPAGNGNVGAGISTGWILTIILLSFALVYLVAGILFNKLYRKESGRDVIPNVTFWSVLPGYIKDGFGFTISKIRRREYQPV